MIDMPEKNEMGLPLTQRNLFEFDLNGFVILKEFLSQDKIDFMNRVIDTNLKDTFCIKFPFLEMDPVFMDLLSDMRVMKICEYLLGDSFRSDTVFGFQEVPPHVGRFPVENLHGGPYAEQGSFFYHWHDGRSRCAHLQFTYVMEPVKAGEGGLVVVPGSHKLNFPMSGKQVYHSLLEKSLDAPWIMNPALDAGDLIIFNEALIHGTKDWRPADPNRRRRNLYIKYCPGFMSWRDPEELKKYLPLARSQLERNLLRGPYVARIDDAEMPFRLGKYRTRTIPT